MVHLRPTGLGPAMEAGHSGRCSLLGPPQPARCFATLGPLTPSTATVHKHTHKPCRGRGSVAVASLPDKQGFQVNLPDKQGFHINRLAASDVPTALPPLVVQTRQVRAAAQLSIDGQ